MSPELIPIVLILSAAVLVGKEFILHHKNITLAINSLSIIACLGYSVFYILVSMSVITAPAVYLASMN